MNKNIIEYIKEKWDCVSYARLVLGLPVYKSGDRCKSFRPDAQNPSSLLIENNHWCDFGADTRGDIIDLCAIARHNGDKGEAIRELAGDKFTFGMQDWKKYTDNLTEKIIYWHKSLRQEDIAYLHSRKINDDTIERLKLGYSHNEKRLMIPYTKNNHFVYWIGRDRSGNPDAPKYKKMFIDNFNEHVPWGLHTLTKDFDQRMPELAATSTLSFINRKDYLIVAEGAFDAMSFEQEGFHVLSPICGFFSAPQRDAFLTAAKQHKYVFICFDSDNAGSKFQMQAAKLCFSHRINFVCGSLPKGIKDVSDYYTDNGNLADLINNAQNGVQFLAASIQKEDEFADFIRSASRFIRKSDIVQFCNAAVQFNKNWLKSVINECTAAPLESFIVDEIKNSHELKFVEAAGFYEYTHGVWKLQPDNIIKAYIADALGFFATGSRLSSIIGHLKARISCQEEFNTAETFNMLNGTLDLNSFKLREHSPADMSCIQAPFSFNQQAQCPKWLKFLDDVMEHNQQKINLLQELAGYVLYPDNSLQKCFFLMGDGGNGKSVFIDVLTDVFGEKNCSTVEISSLATPFDAIRLRNSLINFSSETKSNIKEAEAVFKAVVTGDRISSAYKGKDAVEFRPHAKWVCATNSYISSNDISSGLTRRLIFVRFNRTFSGKDADRDLTRKLCEEKAGIFNWILQGYKRLKNNHGEFTQTDEQVELLDNFIKTINPVLTFYEEELLSLSGFYDNKELYVAYLTWAKSAGFSPKNRNNFVHSLKAVLSQKRPDISYRKSNGKWGFDLSLPPLEGGLH